MYVIEYIPTIFDKYETEVPIKTGPFKFELIDTIYRGDYEEIIRKQCFPVADAILLCFLVISVASFQALETRWKPLFSHELPKVPFTVIATKVDLREDPPTLEKLEERYKRGSIIKRKEKRRHRRSERWATSKLQR